MREILFRGQRVDNGEWVYGSLINNAFYKVKSRETVFYIFNPEDCEDAYSFEDFTDNYGYYEVKPESIGQFTGMLDKNGNKIFEGDKCKVTFYNHIEKSSELIMNIVFTDGGFALIKEGKITTESIIEDDRTFVPLYYSQRPNKIEVI